MKGFELYVAGQEPLSWTIVTDHPTPWLIGNNEMTINYIRFNLIMDAVQEYFQKNSVVVDVGVYPGVMPKIFYEFYPRADYEYYGCGMGFDKNFREKMKTFNVNLLECDLDPRLHLSKGRKISIPLENEKANLCIFTDVIEHFFDPFYPLKEVNRVCKLGAIIILTTDNLTRAGWALLRDISPNVPLIEGNLFYEGDWRPHFREYSKDELFQLLQWAGFEVVSHQFYEAEFGLYRVVDRRLKKVARGLDPFAKRAKNFIRMLLNKAVPHLRDSHILIAQKKSNYETMQNSAPQIVDKLEQWIWQRKKFSRNLRN